jgi:prepilin-type N-terminal cleavage/methylation domain-containing protein
MSARRPERGVTLTELLVVIAIIGLTVAFASVYMSAKVKTIDIANQVGDLVREGSRRAVALGPVRSNVALAMGTRARTRIVGSGTTQVMFTLQRLQESPAPAATASWIDVATVTVDKSVLADSFGNSVGSYAALARSSTWSAFVAYCYPEGKCDARTLFFKAVKPTGTSDTYAKLAVMPLGGAVMTRRDWN